MFVKAPILNNFDPKHYIRIEINAFDYTIGQFLSQLTLNNLDPKHLIVIFSRKIIFAETGYETYDGELLAIYKAFKT